MALITGPTATQVFNRAKRLDPSHFEGCDDDSDIVTLIDEQILPKVSGPIDDAADEAAGGLDFPFSDDVLALAYPSYTEEQRGEKAANIQGLYFDAMLYQALFVLYDLVDSADEFYTQQSDRYKKLSQEALAAAVLATQKVAASTTTGATPETGMARITLNLDETAYNASVVALAEAEI